MESQSFRAVLFIYKPDINKSIPIAITRKIYISTAVTSPYAAIICCYEEKGYFTPNFDFTCIFILKIWNSVNRSDLNFELKGWIAKCQLMDVVVVKLL